MEMGLTQEVMDVATSVCRLMEADGGSALIVGGAVRDACLGLSSKDCDIEVYGVPPEKLKQLLTANFETDLVGEAFGVIKLRHVPVDISIPRRESKSGLGHRGFDILSDPTLTVEEAASRRDFTINAMAYDPVRNELLDPYGGERDLREGILRHTSEKFSEDPLRVLRGMQFVARFDLIPAPETVSLCKKITPEGLARERVFEEWSKLILKGVKPSKGLSFLRDCGWIQYYPELEALIGCTQDPEWHPEGDVWNHTLHSMDAFAAQRGGDDREDLIVGLAVLCHDFGKPATTQFEEGRIRSRGHEMAGAEPARSFLQRMTNETDLPQEVIALVIDHLRPMELYNAQAGNGAIRRLARRVGRIDRLVRVARADRGGRPGLNTDTFPEGEWLLTRARELAVQDSAPQPIVMGRHLIKLGLSPGPHFSKILSECYEAQLDGTFTTVEGGIAFAKGVIP